MVVYLPDSKFPLGELLITQTAAGVLAPEDINKALLRHALGDWGELDPEDRTANDRALNNHERLLSAYTSSSGVKFWIITEWDRSITTVLLPEDY